MRNKGFTINNRYVPLMTRKDARKVNKEHKKPFLNEVKLQVGNFYTTVKIFKLTRDYVYNSLPRRAFYIKDHCTTIEQEIKDITDYIQKMKTEIEEAKKDEYKMAAVIKWYMFVHTQWKYEINLFVNNTLDWCNVVYNKEIKENVKL